ncbi:NAD(P)-dependent oxidoreductase [Halomonas dongshanensis]|uniref:NAD(P)-dependent oxidoreductase n=1 Tax=Halomonas dongshanensis TaxID=2890835 RepID=A0ABT2EDU4_9GAMM|nr:NAD(P)-dependent oxidoreductase [Halomonas dongshanensis]MCS2609761.1 NAD(P)-dependent oxidoreductase [Halomonas dongshanensis]
MNKAVGFIGLGVMGAGMARNIIEAGIPLTITTSSDAKADQFRQLGASVVATPREVAARAKLIVTCVPDAASLRAIIAGPEGIATTRWQDGLLLDCSTIAPFEAEEMAERLEAVGGQLMDAPVSGGRKGAESGTLTIMCGGEASLIERARHILEAMGKNIHHVGPLGAGQAVKACNQLMVAINLMGVCEAIALARSAGVDPKLMQQVLSTGAARSGVLEAHGQRYIDHQLEGGFRSDLMKKDLGIAAAVGAHYQRTQPATALAHQLMQVSCNAGFAHLDSAALGLLYDKLNGSGSRSDSE